MSEFPITSLNEPAQASTDLEPRDDKLQMAARQLVSSLFMLVRSAKMYEPGNQVFEKPIAQLQQTINHVIQKDGKLELLGIKQSFYLNGQLVRMDIGSLDSVRSLLEEMRARDVGGLTALKQVTITELKNFVLIFAKDQNQDVGEDGVKDNKLLTMKLAKWSRLKSVLENDKDEGEARLDRKKYALTCYARAILFVRKYFESMRDGKPIATARVLRVIQDLVDISIDHRVHFLGLTTTRLDSEYLVYHSVNTALIAIVYGVELGLTKPQLCDLGYIALFHDAGMDSLPDELLKKQGALSAGEKEQIKQAPLTAIRNILQERHFNRTTLLRLVTTFEYKSDFAAAVRDAQGNFQMLIPRANLGLYARLISIAATYDALTSKRPYRDAYGPDVAVMLMWTELKNKFDPDLLKVFMRVMAIAPLKVLTKRQQSLTLGAL